MNLTKVLENWSDYDNRKKKYADARFFSCTETWEVDYLVKKIKEGFPLQAEGNVKKAIEECCRALRAPHPRDQFVTCVLQRLGLQK